MDTTNPYAQYGLEDYAAFATPNEQTAFTRRSLFALTLAVLFQIVVLAFVFWVVSAEQIVDFISRGGRFSWLAALGLYLAYAYVSKKLHVAKSTSSSLQAWAFVAHILVTSLILVPLFALSTTIDASIPATAAIVSLIVFGGMSVYSQFGSLERFRNRAVLFLAFLAVGSALLIAALSGRGLSGGDWLSLVGIVLTALFIVIDIGNMLCRYRTDEWMRLSMTMFTTFAVVLCASISIAIFFFGA